MEIFRQLLEGVRYIHSEDVLHRDLKVRFAFTVTGLQFIGVFFFFVVTARQESKSPCYRSFSLRCQ